MRVRQLVASRLVGHNLINQNQLAFVLESTSPIPENPEFCVFRAELESQEEEYWRQYSGHKQQLLLAEDEYR